MFKGFTKSFKEASNPHIQATTEFVDLLIICMEDFKMRMDWHKYDEPRYKVWLSTST